MWKIMKSYAEIFVSLVQSSFCILSVHYVSLGQQYYTKLRDSKEHVSPFTLNPEHRGSFLFIAKEEIGKETHC